MKSLYKYVSGLVLTGFLSVAVITTASAQHGGGHISVGGGFHGSSFGGGFRTGISSRSSFATNIGARFTGVHGVATYVRGGFYRPGFGYYGYPHLGFYLGGLPFGYYPFYWGADLYYYYGGVFYTPYDGGGYQVATPPVGAAVPNLPQGAKSIVIDGQQFYEMNGVYYKAVVNDQKQTVYEVAGRDGVLNTNDDGTVVPDDAAPKVGDIVNELPDGCRKVTLNGKKYYVSPNDIYYQSFVDRDGNTGYRIASIPTDDDDQ